MDITITPGKLTGTVGAIPSKSQAHRMLICAAFADRETRLLCPQTNQDIEATAACLQALRAEITRTKDGYTVQPVKALPKAAVLPCGESGSTLRFLLPVVGALGIDGTFFMEGRLPQRPLSPLWEEMARMGCHLSRPTANTIRCQGRLMPGAYTMGGSVSSQFISGLRFAQCLMDKTSTLKITGKLESKPYIDLTEAAIAQFSGFSGCGRFRSPGLAQVEGDWSGGAFWLVAKALGSDLTVTNLNPASPQGDRAIVALLPELRESSPVSAADIPDLVPVLAVYAAATNGAVFSDIRRLRLKESDRVASVLSMLQALGGRGEATETTLTIHGTGLTGGTVDSENDHRIAMAAAIAATVCKESITILGAQCVEKSYPQFWAEYRRLGGIYEQYIR